jgi:ParB family chromosome partitioning protein
MAVTKRFQGIGADIAADMQAYDATPAGEREKPIRVNPHVARTAPGKTFGLQAKVQEAEERAEKAEAELERLRQAAGSDEAMQAAEQRAMESENALDAAEEALKEALKGQPVRKMLISDLYEVPGRRRKLSATQFEELKANLKNNKLINPVTVRLGPHGNEVVAGYNRVQAFRELGRTEIDINVLELDDDDTERAAFYSNLLSPSLPDYEKFIGFKARMASKNLTQAQVAEEAGISAQQLSGILSFEDLPEAAFAVIKNVPDKFGYDAMRTLAAFHLKGKTTRVLETIQKIAAGELTQAAAIQYAKSGMHPKTKRPDPITIRQGRHKYCEIIHSDKTLKLVFASSEEAQDAIAALMDWIKARASK